MIEVRTLSTQVFQGPRRPRQSRLTPVSSEVRGFFKPSGGLWTSSWETAFTAGWPYWTRAAGFDVCEHGWLLEPVESRVITIDGIEAATALEQRYGSRLLPELSTCGFDWEAIAADADAVRLTVPYELRFARPLASSIVWYGWDCESTWWARWRFAGKPRYVDLREYAPLDADEPA